MGGKANNFRTKSHRDLDFSPLNRRQRQRTSLYVKYEGEEYFLRLVLVM